MTMLYNLFKTGWCGGTYSWISREGSTTSWSLWRKMFCSITKVSSWLTLKALKYFVLTMETKGFYQFEIIINVFVSSFGFIWIPMVWVYGHYKYFTLSVLESTLKSVDIRIWHLKLRRLKSILALKGLKSTENWALKYSNFANLCHFCKVLSSICPSMCV